MDRQIVVIFASTKNLASSDKKLELCFYLLREGVRDKEESKCGKWRNSNLCSVIILDTDKGQERIARNLSTRDRRTETFGLLVVPNTLGKR